VYVCTSEGRMRQVEMYEERKRKERGKNEERKRKEYYNCVLCMYTLKEVHIM
jgi:hypothetical protein